MQHFFAGGCKVSAEGLQTITKLNEVLMQLDHVIAPKKEKYQLQTNQLSHFANEHKSMFIENHRAILSRYIS